MAKSRQTLRVRVSQTTSRRRKKPASQVERVFDEVKALVSDTGERLIARSNQRKATMKSASAKKAGRSRIRRGQQRQATVKQAARTRGGKTS